MAVSEVGLDKRAAAVISICQVSVSFACEHHTSRRMTMLKGEIESINRDNTYLGKAKMRYVLTLRNRGNHLGIEDPRRAEVSAHIYYGRTDEFKIR